MSLKVKADLRFASRLSFGNKLKMLSRARLAIPSPKTRQDRRSSYTLTTVYVNGEVA